MEELVKHPERIPEALANRAHCWPRHRLAKAANALTNAHRFEEAIGLFDAVIDYPGLDAHIYSNALFAVQQDNSGRPIVQSRSERYLACCLSFGGNGYLHLNASGVYLELGDHESAMLQLLQAKELGFYVESHLNNDLARPLYTHARFAELSDGLKTPANPPGMIELAHKSVAAAFAGDLDTNRLANSIPHLLRAWQESHDPTIAESLDRISSTVGKRVGYGFDWFESACETDPSKLLELVRNSSCVRTEVRYQDVHAWAPKEWNDPRFTGPVLQFFQSPPALLPESHQSEELVRNLIDNLVAVRDLRAIKPLLTIARQSPANMGITGKNVRRWLQEAAHALAKFVPQVDHPKEEEVALAAIEGYLENRPGLVWSFSQDTVVPAEPVVTVKPPAVAPLSDAVSKLHKGDAQAAMESLLALWRQTRSPEIARLIDLVDRRTDVSESIPPLPRKNTLAATNWLWTYVQKIPDPRVGSRLLETFPIPPFIQPVERDGETHAFWQQYRKLCEHLEDVRLALPYRTFAGDARWLSQFADSETEELYGAMCIGGHLEQIFEQMAGQLEAITPCPLSDAEQSHCQELLIELSDEVAAERQASLAQDFLADAATTALQAVAARPDDDGLRLAYASLIRDSEPRQARYIEMQMNRPEDEEEPEHTDMEEDDDQFEGEFEAHLQDERLAWMGPLARVQWAFMFSRGFLSKLVLQESPKGFTSCMAQTSSWSTVEALVCRKPDLDCNRFLSEVIVNRMPALRELSGVSMALLIKLGRHPQVVRHLQIQLKSAPTFTQWDDMETSLRNFPDLEILALSMEANSGIESLAPLFRSGVLHKGIRTLRLIWEKEVYLEIGSLHEAAVSTSLECLDLQWGNVLDFSVFVDAAGALQEPGTMARRSLDSARRLFDATLQREWRLCIERDATNGLGGLRAQRRGVRQAGSNPDSLCNLTAVVKQFPVEVIQSLILEEPDDAPEPSAAGIVALGTCVQTRWPDAVLETCEPCDSPRRVQALVDDIRSDGAIRKLGRFKSKLALRPLATCLLDDETREQAAQALIAIADVSIEKELRFAIEHGDTTSVIIAGQLGLHTAVSAISKLLRSDKAAECRAAAGALGKIGDASCIPSLRTALAHNNQLHKDRHNPAILLALAQLGCRDIVNTVREMHRDLLQSTWLVLGLIGGHEDIALMQDVYEKRRQEFFYRSPLKQRYLLQCLHLGLVLLNPSEIGGDQVRFLNLDPSSKQEPYLAIGLLALSWKLTAPLTTHQQRLVQNVYCWALAHQEKTRKELEGLGSSLYFARCQSWMQQCNELVARFEPFCS